MSEVIAPTINQIAHSEIPTEWVFVNVNTIAASVKNAIVGGPFGSDLVSKDYVSDGVPVIRGQNMGEHWLQEPYVFVTEEKAKALEANLARPGDIVFTQRGTLGQVSLVPRQKYERYLISQSQMKVSLNDSLADSRYFHYWFSAPQGQATITQSAIQTGVPHINLGILRSLPLLLPPLAEQVGIASSLSDMDALIGGLDQLIAKKRDIQQAAMQQLLTGQRRLPGFSGEWECKKLADIADPKKSWSFTGGPFGSNLQSADYTTDGVRIIQLQNIGVGTFHDNYAVFTSESKADELVSCNVYPGDLILSKMGDPVARACIVPTSAERFLMCSDGIRLAIDQGRFNSLFILHSINTKVFLERAEAASTGSTRKRIGLTQLRRLPIFCPSLKEQTAIATILSDMDAELATLEARRDKARQLKQGMMQELLTGRIRLV